MSTHSKDAFVRFTTDMDTWQRNAKQSNATNYMESAFDTLLELAKHFRRRERSFDKETKCGAPRFDEQEQCMIEMEWALHKEDAICSHPVTEMVQYYRDQQERSSVLAWSIPKEEAVISVNKNRWLAFADEGMRYMGAGDLRQGMQCHSMTNTF